MYISLSIYILLKGSSQHGQHPYFSNALSAAISEDLEMHIKLNQQNNRHNRPNPVSHLRGAEQGKGTLIERLLGGCVGLLDHLVASACPSTLLSISSCTLTEACPPSCHPIEESKDTRPMSL